MPGVRSLIEILTKGIYSYYLSQTRDNRFFYAFNENILNAIDTITLSFRPKQQEDKAFY